MGPYPRGVLLAVGSAVAFGLTAPIIKRAGLSAGPFATAALLYGGAALATLPWVVRGRPSGGRLARGDLPRLLLIAVAGALLAPACLAWGLRRTSAVTGSLLLNTEAVFTVGLAALLFREHLGRRVVLALACVTAGGAVLVASAGGALAFSSGAAAVVLASLLWAVDNSVTRGLADRDLGQLVAAKAGLGATLSLALALVAGDAWPAIRDLLTLGACGAVGFGLSLRLYVAAQRALGAGRTASVFATAPFLGAFAALALGEPATVWVALAGVLCALGVWLHLTEHHGHAHSHAAVEHDHLHRHDDGHHTHSHDPPVMGEHSHMHRHEAQSHTHEHAPDLHHQHDH
jgi:drug/metabolite transporter (DMT)-like permease